MPELKEYDLARLVRDDADSGLVAGTVGTVLSDREGDTYLVEFFVDPDEPAKGNLYRISALALAKAAA